MFKKPDKVHQWIVLIFFIVSAIGAGGKITYDIDMNKTRSTENSETNEIIKTENAVIKAEIEHLKEQNQRALDKLDRLLER